MVYFSDITYDRDFIYAKVLDPYVSSKNKPIRFNRGSRSIVNEESYSSNIRKAIWFVVREVDSGKIPQNGTREVNWG